ncbi:MAG: dihydropyrimidinase [Alphaproteobacteria bacterium]|nr:dihydropyrimidinase [Alphaproteobacteria bacterium]
MPPAYDLVIRNGKIVTAADTFDADVCVRDGRVVALEGHAGPGAREIDATGRLVMPGGIDSHCHIEQMSSAGVVCADDFYSGTVSAAFGGTTTVIPFAAQHRGQSLRQVVRDYHAAAEPKAVVDYAFHLIISDPTEQVLGQELPALIGDGYTSFKIYMTYERLRIADGPLLDILALARRTGALVMVHAENHDMIQWMTERLLEQGLVRPLFHAVSHPRLAESEATNRAISLAELVDVPVLLVHVSAPEAARVIREAQTRGLRIYAETCPQYVMLGADDLDKSGMDGAMFCCSPPPRDAAGQAAIWQGLVNGTFQVFSSDHAPYRFDRTGKLPRGDNTTFKEIANGLPGLETRLPILFSEGVWRGRITVNQFVALGATNHARLYGLYPRKGTIAVGSDADMAIWDPDRRVKLTASLLHDQVGYTPYEGVELTGWPVTVISRGRIVVDQGKLHATRGSGQFLKCAQAEAAKPLGRVVPELATVRRFSDRPLF